MTLDELLTQINTAPDQVQFQDVMQVIADHYQFTPTAFSNGIGDAQQRNAAGSNEGSCKILAFAQLNQLSPEHTLACFGDYYRQDVLQHPDGDDHGNIRNFIRHGWAGIEFDQFPLQCS